MLVHGNFVELSIVLLLGKCPPFSTILSSKCFLASGHPAHGVVLIGILAFPERCSSFVYMVL